MVGAAGRPLPGAALGLPLLREDRRPLRGRTETIEAGQAYYIAPGHAIEFLEDSEALEFTPTAALERTFAAIRRNSAAATDSARSRAERGS